MTNAQKEAFNFAQNVLKPKPLLSGSEWADKYFHLSAESSSLPGKWKTRPYQKEIIDCMTDDKSQYVIIKKPTRVGYNKMINIVVGYFIHQQPSVILYYSPTDSEAKNISEDEIEPMIRDNEEVSKLIELPSVRGRTKKEKTIKKNYPGGYIEMLGATSDKNLNRRTSRLVIADEIDAIPKEAGKAGDTITTMFRRSQDFNSRKNIAGGKPVGGEYNESSSEDESYSMVDYWYKQGDMRQRHLPCPECKTLQLFEFEDLMWDKEKDEHGKTKKHLTETAHFICKECEYKIFHNHKRWMDENGKWIAQKPFNKKASFHFWAILSYSPNVQWKDIVDEFLEAKNNRLKLKAFYNEVLGRTWEEDYTKFSIDDFDKRLEDYPAQVPDAVLVLSCGVDTQDDRLEAIVTGWSANYESYSITHKVFYGDTTKPDVWQDLDNFLLKSFFREDNRQMKIYCTAVDTGGHSTVAAYAFCKPRHTRKVFAIKGAKAIDARIAPRTATYTNKSKVPLYMVGVNQSKNMIYSFMITETKGAGYMHFPRDEAYNEEFFNQLASEKRDSLGRWEKTRARNEIFDLVNYAYIALFLGNVDLEVLEHHGAMVCTVATTKKAKPRKQKSYLDEY